MNEYLHNRLIKYIAPKTVMEVTYTIPYDCNVPGVLSPKEVDDLAEKVINFNFGK